MSTQSIVVPASQAVIEGQLEPRQSSSNPFKAAAQALLERAKSIVKIQSPADYQMAAQLLKIGANAAIKVGQFYDPKVADARKPWDNLCSERKAVLDSLKETRDYATARMNEFEEEQRRIAQAKQDEIERQQREEQQRIMTQRIEDERKFREAEAANLQLQGKPEEAAEVMAAPIEMAQHEPEFVPDAYVRPNIPEVQGIGGRKTYKAKLSGKNDAERAESMVKLCAAIGRGEVPPMAVQLNETFANSMARSIRDLLTWPGVEVEAVKTKSVSRR